MNNMDEHFNTLDHQDWKPIIVRKNAKNNVANSKKKVDNATLKKISIEKKSKSRIILFNSKFNN